MVRGRMQEGSDYDRSTRVHWGPLDQKSISDFQLPFQPPKIKRKPSTLGLALLGGLTHPSKLTKR